MDHLSRPHLVRCSANVSFRFSDLKGLAQRQISTQLTVDTFTPCPNNSTYNDNVGCTGLVSESFSDPSQKKNGWCCIIFFSLKHFLWTDYIKIDVTTTEFCLTGYPKNITLYTYVVPTALLSGWMEDTSDSPPSTES